jgi:aspartate carbamoyltransferase catalytic subunit
MEILWTMVRKPTTKRAHVSEVECHFLLMVIAIQEERAEAQVAFEKKRTYYSMRGRTLLRETREHLQTIKVPS